MQDKCPYSIIYEDKMILVVYKKRDVFTLRTNDKRTFSHNLYHYLHDYTAEKNERIFIVHRLDYETSGILIFAKSYQIKETLQKAFENREVARDYEAVIKERIPLHKSFHVEQYLEKIGFNVVASSPEKGKLAITDIDSINYINIGTALKINISTGRKNQIRLAINSLQFTLIGDKRYSNDEAKRMYLNEYHLGFKSETGLAQLDFNVEPLWIKCDA